MFCVDFYSKKSKFLVTERKSLVFGLICLYSALVMFFSLVVYVNLLVGLPSLEKKNAFKMITTQSKISRWSSVDIIEVSQRIEISIVLYELDFYPLQVQFHIDGIVSPSYISFMDKAFILISNDC